MEDWKYNIHWRYFYPYICCSLDGYPSIMKVNCLAFHQFIDEDIKYSQEDINIELNELLDDGENCLYNGEIVEFNLKTRLTNELVEYIQFCLKYFCLDYQEYEIVNDYKIIFKQNLFY